MHHPPTGLCECCCHVRIIHSPKGSTFYLCQRSLTDPAFKKYPPLPVLNCRGHEPAPPPTSGHEQNK